MGHAAEFLHRQVGRCAAESGLDALIAVQGAARFMAEEAVRAGMPPHSVHFFERAEDAGDFVRQLVQPGDAILFKGSRGVRDRTGDGESPGLTMLYFLLYEKLSPMVSAFRVFRYVTSRTAFASLTALFLCIALGPWLIGKLREFQIGQYIREEGPKSHQKKAGTPTMGGVLIIVSIVVPTLLWADLRNSYVWIAVFTLLAYGAIGFVDDYAKVDQAAQSGTDRAAQDAVSGRGGLRGGGRADVHAHVRRLFHGHERSVPEALQAHAADLLAAGESAGRMRWACCRSSSSWRW